MVSCPHCGADNRPGVRFCKQCGKSLGGTAPTQAAGPACPRCGAPLRPGVRFCKQCGQSLSAPLSGTLCPNCGKPLRAEAVFCAHCGARLARPPAKKACPYCGAPARTTARFCPCCRAPLVLAPTSPPTGPRCANCGAPTRPGARFCRNCSRPLTTTPPPLSPSQQPGLFGTGDLLPLTILTNRYVIMEKIAQGGMGAVYKAQDRRLQGKIVAVKEMSESAIVPAERKRVLDSFQREAELLARLGHPNLVRVTDRFQEREHHFMVMEFIAGQTLGKMLEGRSEPFPEEQVLVWAEQLCDVLAYLHSQEPKIIYRDIKPANVMVVDGSDQVKLIDFGIARFFKPGKRKDTIEFGTDGYAPPEQYGKSQTDERADVYALGAMLHHLLTLRDPVTRPFSFPPLRSLNSKVSRRVEAAIAKAVNPAMAKRHQSIVEMWVALLGEGAAGRRRLSMKGRMRGPARPVGPAAAPPAVLSELVSTPSAVDFGPVLVGGDAPDRSLLLTFPTGELVALSTDVLWLHVRPRNVSRSGGRVTITLDTTRLKSGRLQLQGGWLKRGVGWPMRLLVPGEQKIQGHVELQVKGGQVERVPVSVTAVPQSSKVCRRWRMALLVILVEAVAVILVLGAVVVGLLAAWQF